VEKFNPWAEFEKFLLPREGGDDGEGIANRKINAEAFRNNNWKGPTPRHFKARLLPELAVLAGLKRKFRDTDPDKFNKVCEAIQNFKTTPVNWEDF